MLAALVDQNRQSAYKNGSVVEVPSKTDSTAEEDFPAAAPAGCHSGQVGNVCILGTFVGVWSLYRRLASISRRICAPWCCLKWGRMQRGSGSMVYWYCDNVHNERNQ